MTVRSSNAQVLLALPIHNRAGVSTPQMGGIFSAIMDIGGGLIGSIFGNKAKKQELENQRSMAQDQLYYAKEIAQLQKDVGMREIDAAVQTQRIRAQNELAAIDAAYAAHLSSQRAQKQVAEDTLSAQLLSQSQSGIFGLAQSGMEQAGSISRTYPRTAAATLVALVVGTAIAISYMKRPPSRSSGRGKGGGAPKGQPAPGSVPS